MYDVVGIGFGPSNLALAVAIDEHNQRQDGRPPLRAAFFEKQPRFGWHRGMLIDGATMQVSFLKDLVTMRNPTSEFGFLSYLKDRGRLADFINHKTMFPTRVEFHDYLEWVADGFGHLVEYGSEVVAVHPVETGGVTTRAGGAPGGVGGRPPSGRIDALDVIVRQGDDVTTRRTRNLVIAAGLEAALPDGVRTGDRIWHNHDLLNRLEDVRDPRRFLVVGAGQSAAETTEYLHRAYPGAEVCAIFSRYGYSPADDSSFANRIFDPGAVEDFYAAPEDVKKMLLAYHNGTNYSVVDLDLIDELYRRVYQEKVTGTERLRVLNASRVVDLSADGEAVHAAVEFLPTGAVTRLDADVIVFATGYRPRDPLTLLGEVGERCLRREQGGLRVERDYRIATADDVTCGIYLQGATEHTHGITSSLLSNTAIRSGEIVQTIAARLDRPADTDAAPYVLTARS